MSRILVVDDDETIRQIMREFIELEGHEVVEADSAISARQALAKAPVDLVFMDVNMPGESGASLCRSIKEDPECQNIKVVILTGYDSERSWRQGLGSGPDLFAVKPVNRERIKVLLEELLPAAGTKG